MSFSNPSFGRNSSRMSPGFSGRGSDSAFGMGPQRSPGMSSPQSAFRQGGNRGPASSPSGREADSAGSLLAHFGLSFNDLEELSRFPEDRITAKNLPDIIQHLKRGRSGHMEMPRRASFDDRPSGFKPFGDYGRELDYQERRIDDAFRDRERRVDRFLSELSFHKSDGDYVRPRRGKPSARNIDDFHGIPAKVFPQFCSLCDLSVNSIQCWNEHVSGVLHQKQCRLLLELYPQWKGHEMDGNRAPGNMGPPPMAGPGTLHGNRPGTRGMPGPKPMKKQGSGRVVHILDFERRNNVKTKILKLLEPFGMVTNSLILNTRNEAFIEMSTQAQALAAVKYFETNPARLYGKPVKVLLSVKYKSIKKDESNGNAPDKEPKKPLKKLVKPGAKPTEGIGRVLRICNLPISGYPDRAVVRLAEKFGTVKNYILMRKLRQIFIEMENLEDAKTMVDSTTKTPLIFKGKPLKILISQKYKTLVLRMPNPTDKKSKQGKFGKKKLKTDTSDIVTTEEDVTGSCDPEEGEEAEAAAAEDNEQDQNKDQNNASKDQSETAPADMEDFVTLDEIGSDANKKQNEPEQPVEEMEITEELGPYQPNVPVGVSYVMAKTGFYCKLCSLFYTSEEMAKVKHCSSLAHYQKLKEIMDKPSSGNTPEPETEQEH